MKYRTLGRDGPKLSAIGLGCMSLGIADTHTSSVQSDDDAVALIHRAMDLGITLLDTADVYGDSEVKVGKAIRPSGPRGARKGASMGLVTPNGVAVLRLKGPFVPKCTRLPSNCAVRY